MEISETKFLAIKQTKIFFYFKIILVFSLATFFKNYSVLVFILDKINVNIYKKSRKKNKRLNKTHN